jgi:hypothetical protein
MLKFLNQKMSKSCDLPEIMLVIPLQIVQRSSFMQRLLTPQEKFTQFLSYR